MPYEVDLTYIRTWLEEVDRRTYDSVLAAVRVLRLEGPSLGRPLVDTLKGSRHKNMKELRFPSPGRSEIRILFAFDPRSEAIMLLAGDKHGLWDKWYPKSIAAADRIYDEHLLRVQKEAE